VAWVRIGRVARALGLKGYIGVAGSEGALGRIQRVVLRRGEVSEERRVVEARRQGRLWAVRVDGIDDRGGAEGLVGSEVLAERGDLGEAGQGRFFWGDLEGLRVETVGGAVLGEVSGFMKTGAVDVLVVSGAGGETLIPLAPYVKVEPGRVVVDPPPGLLAAEASDGEKGGEPEEP